MTDLRKAAAIVGVHEHPTRFAPDKSEWLIQAESAIAAIQDAGLGIAFNCQHDKLKEVADVVIEKKDLREVLKYILQ